MSTNYQVQDSTYCSSEYDTLKKVLLCEPHHLTVRNGGSGSDGIEIEHAVSQHAAFVSVLRQNDIDVTLLPHHKKFPEQVYTRDIGFTLGQTIFVGKIASSTRIGEENILKQWLEDEELSYYNLAKDKIEGGDVLIDEDNVYIGLSERTHQKAVDHLQSLLPHYKIRAIPFKEKFLHLDCIFNVISPTVALVYREALTDKDLQFFSSRYDLIAVTKAEQKKLATNVLSIGSNKVISLPSNTEANQQMRQKGFDVLEVDFTEIIKAGGSFRCCTLPILREQNTGKKG
ncbi:dimethylarginine dimethylaminohydrolase family protein [Bacillus sp. AK031]